MLSEKPKEGWTWLINVKKEHYFRNGRSLCGRWLCLGNDLYPDPDHFSESCQTCLKKRRKELEHGKTE